MLLGFIIEAAAGLLCIALGLLIRKKQAVSLLHDYHYKNVKSEDIPAYARLMGLGLILVGAGICVTGVLLFFELPFWWVAMLTGLIAGILTMNKAQKKYNGSWFS
ncbi:MAG: DUF3784 domain-containing protein [Clostridia bacterium]|nr:DUF3784 domain-containing protein [Clostridia bacterium]